MSAARRRTGRHSPRTVAAARRLHEAGWTPHEIQKHLTKIGHPVAFGTVKAWVDPEYRARRNRTHAEDMRRMRDVSGNYVKRRMIALADAGLTPAAISVVVGLYHGRDITRDSVVNFLRAHRDHARTNGTRPHPARKAA